MKKLSIKTSAHEGIYESALQLFLISVVWLTTGVWDIAMVSSLVMISKASVENFLTFGKEDKLEDRSFLSKLRLLAKFIPVFGRTAGFRLGTYAVVTA